MKIIMFEYGHWTFYTEFDPNDWYGFVYRIIEKDTGKQYIGKKQFEFLRRVKKKGRKNRKITRKESDWKEYTGSSNQLNEAIEKNGKEKYEFIIESLHSSKGSLHYAEVELQIKENVLRETLDNGEKKYYNGQISAVKFKPPAETLQEMRINKHV